ncbi:SUMF1/EgtB/PvdO family nonheme iron enzyme [Lentibacillus sp. N15]|uniref:SUMF1/EgtB/PvdO family nonheme iron enzyme n=1 Tax=Lentibacillus songyuanensis TaxID=3136161 RepID=UPI0031BAD623
MSFILSVKDTYRQAVEAASGGKNTVMYDDKGNPSIMVCIPRFNLSDVIDGAPNTPHPAFIVDGVVKKEIWVSKFQNIVHDGRAYSIPGVDPKASINFNDSKDACTRKGEGWHLMTNAEWAALALWSKKNGTMPRGNNDYGKDHSASYERGVETYETGGRTGRVATGSGPATWSHDHTPFGVFDLNGNVREWVDGLRLIDGKIYVHQDNDFNTPDSLSNWVDTEIYVDNSEKGNDRKESNTVSGKPILNSKRENPMYTGGDVDDYYGYNYTGFEDLETKSGVSTPDLLKYLAIAPTEGDHGGDRFYARNYGERFALRGGHWSHGANAGVFYLYLHNRASRSLTLLGFRSSLVL